MTSFLITGVAGFIGSNLAERLVAEGHRVVGIDNLAYGVSEQVPDGVEFHSCDIRDPAADVLYEGSDVVFHLAAKNCIADCQADPVETFDINVHGTAHVFEAARRAGVRKVVYAESAALYEGLTRFPSAESETRPLSVYALSKEAARLVAKGYERFAGLVVTGLRYFCVYGPRQDAASTYAAVIPKFISLLLAGTAPTIYGDGEQSRDFTFIMDCVSAVLAACEVPGLSGMVLNVGTGHRTTVNQLCAMLQTVLHTDLIPTYAPPQPGDLPHDQADIEQANRFLSYRPQYDLARGLQETIRSMRRSEALAKSTTNPH